MADGSGEETTAKNVITFQRTMTKRSSFFFNKNRVTPSVAAPGDTDSGDATALARWPAFQLISRLRRRQEFTVYFSSMAS